MKEINVCIPIFNRATYVRVGSVIRLIENDPTMRCTVVLGSSLLQDSYAKAGDLIKREHRGVSFHEIAIKEYTGKARSSLISADIARGFALFLEGKKFDAVVVIADRFETLPAAMVATYMGFNLVHIQGGEVTGNIDERIRHAVSKLSDYHFVSTKMARNYLLEMGEESYSVHRTGCPSLDYIKECGIRRYTPKERYIICMFHPNTQSIETQYEETKTLLQAVMDFCIKEGVKCYWFWPNPDPGREEVIRLLESVMDQYSAFLFKMVNEEAFIFLRKLSGAKLIVGNSSCALREASYLGVPAVNVGVRQNMRERSWNVIDVPVEYEKILQSIYVQFAARRYAASYLYGDTKASQRIVRLLKDIEYEKKGPLNYPLRPKYMEDHIGEKRFRNHKIGIVTGPKPKKVGSGKSS